MNSGLDHLQTKDLYISMELSLLESSAPQEVTDLVARETRNTSVSHMRTAFHETLKPNMGHVTKLIQKQAKH